MHFTVYVHAINIKVLTENIYDALEAFVVYFYIWNNFQE